MKNGANKKCMGIWMDYSQAHSIELSKNNVISNIIKSELMPYEKQCNLKNSESVLQNNKHHLESNYSDRIKEDLKDANEVVLFGPADAKSDFLILLRADYNFKDLKIEVKQANEMTENEQYNFVKKYFKSTLTQINN